MPRSKSNPAVPLEHDEQVGFINWFRGEFPNVLIFAIPNGGWRDKNTAKKLKKEGVTAGVPDLFVPEWRLFIEMKRQRGGTVSDEQKIIMRHLENVGYFVLVGYGAEDASKKILDFLQNSGCNTV